MTSQPHDPYTKIILTGDQNPASSPAARDYYTRKHAAEQPVAACPIPVRAPEIAIDMTEVARLQGEIDARIAAFHAGDQEPVFVDYAYALRQVKQAKASAESVLDYLAEAQKITPAATPITDAAKIVDTLAGEMDRIITELRKLDREQ